MVGKNSAKLPQPSQDSDDNGIMELVAKQMQSSWEKKKKEKEQKFLELAQAELLRSGAMRADEFADAAQKMDSIYEQFVMEYAGVCDDIRRILTAMHDEQKKFLTIVQQQKYALAQSDKEREMGQVRGLAIAKKALTDYGRLIETLELSA